MLGRHVPLKGENRSIAAWAYASASAFFQLGDVCLLYGFAALGGFLQFALAFDFVVALGNSLCKQVAFASQLFFFAFAFRVMLAMPIWAIERLSIIAARFVPAIWNAEHYPAF